MRTLTPEEIREIQELPRGLVAEASAPLPVIQFPDGHTEPAPAGSVLAEDIIGQLTSEQIAELEAAKISGKLTSEQIESIEAAQIVGIIVNEQIGNLEAKKIIGELEAAQIKSIPAVKITGTINETQIANNSISTPKLQANAVIAEKISASAVTTEKLAANAVVAEKIAAGSIIAEKIGAEAVEGTKIAALAITAAKIAANAITTEKINALAVTTAKLAAEAIIAEKISAGAITTEKIAASAITAEKISVKELSAITANLGSITAGTITGATFRTSVSEETVLDKEGLRLIAGNEEVANKGRRIEWLNSSKEIVSTLYVRTSASVNYLYIKSQAASAKDGAIALWVEDTGSSDKLIFEPFTNRKVETAPEKIEENVTGVDIVVNSIGNTYRLIDSAGRSDFLQLTPSFPVKRKLNAGQIEVEMISANTTTAYTKVNHEIGAKPRVTATVTSEGTGAIGGMFAEIKAVGETSFEVRGARPFGAPGKNIKFTIDWIAVG